MTAAAGLVLASASVARRQVLAAAKVPFEAARSNVDEAVAKATLLAAGASPKRVAEVLAERKAVAVSKTRGELVIGADQTLELDGRLHDKVETLDAARARLRELRGRPHRLHSAVVAAQAGRAIWRETVSATLTMRNFSDAFLDDYLAEEGERALGSVGCYRLEGMGVQLFGQIEGDYFTILGLPMMGLMELLRERGLIKP